MKQGKPDGYWKSYYENGKIKSEGNRKDLKVDSLWKFYSDTGKLILEVSYTEGKKNGIKTTYLDKQTLKENFRNDIKEGYTRSYSPDGKLVMEIPFSKGMEQGLAKEYSPDGNIITLIEYKRGFVIERLKINRKDRDNRKQGRWVTFYMNGNVHIEGMYKDDKKDGYFKEYADNGDLKTITKYVDDVIQPEAEEVTKLDIENEYYPNGKIKVSGTYRNGIPEGVRREYDTTGKIVSSAIFKKGIRTGEGIVLEDGSKDGHWKEFYEEGTLLSEGNYKEGKPVGEWKYFYPDGKLEETGKYTNTGKLQGTWKWFNQTGKLMQESEFDKGVHEGMFTEYNEEGNIVQEGDYINGLEDGPWLMISGDYKERGTFHDGLKTGTWHGYYLYKKDSLSSVMDSLPSYVGNFVDDNPDGKHTYFWNTGKLKEEGTFIMGKKEGDWLICNEDGTPFLIITFKNGIETRYDGIKIKPPFEASDN